MKPLKVEFQAFGPYIGHETVDFEEISRQGLFLICGNTGMGKTMILDAMTFALYGKSSGHGRDDLEAMRCTKAAFDADTFVRFIFENHGDIYLFERRLERKRKNLAASCGVSKRDAQGIWQPLLENPREKAVNEKAAEIIGLEYEQFRQVIVLPQGQFERLLTSNSDEKEKILTSIFGEEKWQAIAEHFYTRAEKRRNEQKGVRERILSSLAEEGCDSLSMLEQRVENNREQERKLDEAYRAADIDRIIREQREMLAVANRFGDLHKAEDRLHQLEEAGRERAAWEDKLRDAKRAGKIRPLLEALRGAEDILRKRKKDEADAEESAQEKKAASDKAAARLKEHAEKESQMEEVRRAKVRYEEKRGDYEGLETAERELAAAIKRAEEAKKIENREKQKREDVAGRILQLQTEYQQLQAEHEELLNGYLAGITGELAAQLEPGKPCPVCGSTEHPHKACRAGNTITKKAVDTRKKAADAKYQELQTGLTDEEKAKKAVEEAHAAAEKTDRQTELLSVDMEKRRKNLVPGIESAADLEAEIAKLGKELEEFAGEKERLAGEEKTAREAHAAALARIEAARKEAGDAVSAHDEAARALETGLQENGFAAKEEAEALMLSDNDLAALTSRISDHDAALKAAKESLAALRQELQGKTEPEEAKCREALETAGKAREDYLQKKAVSAKETERLEKKLQSLRSEGEGIEERIREAEEDFAFAKKLRGDSGTGLQRYVLGIMFSSVVTAANRMLEMVHGGRYRLFRSDDKAQGSNKRGLELKVFDRNSADHGGRHVSTLSGGEKFLVSLALSIGMSTVAQKSGIRIEALFIDEGFGSLDDESIGDAMSVLNSIQAANGLVGIISHVQVLQDQIPCKLRVVESGGGSRIIRTIG